MPSSFAANTWGSVPPTRTSQRYCPPARSRLTRGKKSRELAPVYSTGISGYSFWKAVSCSRQTALAGPETTTLPSRLAAATVSSQSAGPGALAEGAGGAGWLPLGRAGEPVLGPAAGPQAASSAAASPSKNSRPSGKWVARRGIRFLRLAQAILVPARADSLPQLGRGRGHGWVRGLAGARAPLHLRLVAERGVDHQHRHRAVAPRAHFLDLEVLVGAHGQREAPEQVARIANLRILVHDHEPVRLDQQVRLARHGDHGVHDALHVVRLAHPGGHDREGTVARPRVYVHVAHDVQLRAQVALGRGPGQELGIVHERPTGHAVVDWIPAVRDAVDLHEQRALGGRVDVGVLAPGPLGRAPVAQHLALDNDLRPRRHEQVVRHALHDLERLPEPRAGHRVFRVPVI